MPERRIIRVEGLNGVKEDKAYFLPRGFESIEKVSVDAIDENQFWVAFRKKNWDPNATFINDLRDRGYRVGTPQIVDSKNEQAILVEFSKNN